MAEVLPCMRVGATTIRPPYTSPMAWWPRHTPRMGISPASSLITVMLTPALSGRPGPGEMRMASGAADRMPSTSMASLR